MKLANCEIFHHCIRGTNTVFIYGDRALTAEEAQALAAEYAETFGPFKAPAFVSPDGWQLLQAAEAKAAPAEQPAKDAAPAAAGAPAEAKATKGKRASA